MARIYAKAVQRDDFDVPTRIDIMRVERSGRTVKAGHAYLTAESDGYTDEYAVIYERQMIGTVEAGIHHSSHGGIFPDFPEIDEHARACRAVAEVI